MSTFLMALSKKFKKKKTNGVKLKDQNNYYSREQKKKNPKKTVS